ncbi:MAG TPA: BBE domain-containing protein [Roseiarcus sp.]
MSIEAGAYWRQAYNALTTNGGRYVQGGGCMTVGVAGLVLGGGFGSFSKAYGMAAASLVEAEIVTADGEIRIANTCSNPDLFWALKGGGGGFGVVTRVTLLTHPLPDFFGGVFATVRATSDNAYRRLIAKTVEFYAQALFNPHWGEQIGFGPDGVVAISMVFQGLMSQQAADIWRPFFDWAAASPQDFTLESAPRIGALPAQHFWDPSVLRSLPGRVLADDRVGAPADDIFWAGNLEEAGAVWCAYQSAWLPASLLASDQREHFVNALVAAAQHRVTLHVNKGLAGATPEAIAATRDTAMNPAVADAFALVISGALGQPAYPGVPGHEPDAAAGRSQAQATHQAMNEIRKLLPRVGSYVWETDFFQPNWQDAFWGENYPRLRAIKDKYDPAGLFFLQHGVGSEDWSADGFTRAN